MAFLQGEKVAGVKAGQSYEKIGPLTGPTGSGLGPGSPGGPTCKHRGHTETKSPHNFSTKSFSTSQALLHSEDMPNYVAITYHRRGSTN